MTPGTTCFVDVEAGAPMPAEWSPYPSVQEVAEFEALMVELGCRDADALPHPDEIDEHPALSHLLADPVQALSLLTDEGSAADSFDLGVLSDLDPASLADPEDRVAVLRALTKVEGLVSALRIRALTALGGTTPAGAHLDEVHIEHEIAVAGRTSEYAAGKALEVARTITSTFPDLLTALRGGRVSWAHCAVLVDRTRFVADEAALAQIGERALVRALTRTPGQFGTEVEKLVVRFDPDAAERHRRARKKDRTVWVKRLADGMGMLGYVDDWAVVNAVHETIAADARALKKTARDAAATGGATPDGPSDADATAREAPEESADAARATALAARVLGTVGPDGSVTWDRAASTVVHLNLTIDLLSLTRERERIALLDGQPVPAEIGREYAAVATTFRRFVTDPDDDHLIDRGTREYTCDHLRAFVLDRDICRNPVHQHSSPSIALQMDHAEEWPHGSTSASNCGGFCVPSHQLKTARKVDVTDSRSDGSCTWATLWGQVVQLPPRPFLDTPDPPDPEPTPTAGAGPPDDDPPPF